MDKILIVRGTGPLTAAEWRDEAKHAWEQLEEARTDAIASQEKVRRLEAKNYSLRRSISNMKVQSRETKPRIGQIVADNKLLCNKLRDIRYILGMKEGD